MKRAQAQREKRRPVLLGLFLACGSHAFALNPSLDISQYAHTAWRIRDGFIRGAINSIAQTPDGYLWLGTEFGLLRFDGVRKVPWPHPDQPLPSERIRKVLAARDGTLWIGTSNGLASWKDGKLVTYRELAGQRIGPLLEDRDGSIWTGWYSTPKGNLCSIQKGRVQCYGQSGALGKGVFAVYQDSSGTLWGGAVGGLWRWSPGPPNFRWVPAPGVLEVVPGVDPGEDSALLIGSTDGMRRIVDGKIQPYPLPGIREQLSVRAVFRDREGSLWITTRGQGLVHVHEGRTDVFAQPDGLTSDNVYGIYEDREGSIWVGTSEGLDRFREFAAATMPVTQGLSRSGVYSVLGDRAGGVWLGTSVGLGRWNKGLITIYRKPGGRLPDRDTDRPAVREIAVGGLPENGIGSLFQDSRGRIWASTRGGTGYLEHDRFVTVSGIPQGFVRSLAEDTAGNLWIAHADAGLLRLSAGIVADPIPWTRLGHQDYAVALAADPARGGLWIGFNLGGIVYFAGGEIRESYGVGPRHGGGLVNGLWLDRGVLWAATEGGLSRLHNGRIATLTAKDGLPCDSVNWLIEDNSHAFWLLMACGIVRIARSEIDDWAAAVDKETAVKRTIHATVWDNTDGVATYSRTGGFSPVGAKSNDGQLWFASGAINMIDPLHLPANKVLPPVHIEAVKIDGKEATPSEGLELSHRTKDLEIDYTALSLMIPERVRFKYKLEGEDSDWQDVGNRRQAYYSNLSPKRYRFRVIACNNDGVWNEAGATWNFMVLPAYYQTNWFRALMATLIFGAAWALHRFRLHQIAREHNVRIEERVGERTRIARDLHDTLLQSFQGLLFEFQAARNLFPRRPEEAMRTMDDAISGAKAAITEGRDAIQNLRSGSAVHTDLAQLLATTGKELSDAQNSNVNGAIFRLTVEGLPQTLSPVIQDEVYRIGLEILRNAFRHARAEKIEVEIRYDDRLLRLRIRDDGIGIDPKVLGEKACAGHWGLPGVRERVKLVGAKLDFWSEAGAGTEVQLIVPASVAYPKSPDARIFGLFRKTTRPHAE